MASAIQVWQLFFFGEKINAAIWGVQQTRWPAQPGQPTCVRPATTRSDDFGDWTRVPNSLTRPHAGWLSVFLLKPMTPDPNRILSLSDELLQLSNHFRRNLVQILQDLARSWQIRPDFSMISTALNRFRPDLARSGHISASVIKPETDPNQLKTDETRTEKSD